MKPYIIIFLFTLVILLLILSDSYLLLEIRYNKFANSGVTVTGKDVFGFNVSNSERFCDNSFACLDSMCNIWSMKNVSNIVLEPNKKPNECIVNINSLWKVIAYDPYTFETVFILIIFILWYCTFFANLIFFIFILLSSNEIVIRMSKLVLILCCILIVPSMGLLAMWPYFISKFVLYWMILGYCILTAKLLN